ncbi:histidinol dehydrogenase [bacterium]|nr:histidinol dehydrogenase [bacterium]
MKILTHEDKAYSAFVKKLYRRAIPSDAVSDTVAGIVAEVAKKGDQALVAFAEKFDGATLTARSLRVTDAELKAARDSVSQDTKDAIKSSLKNIHAFAAKSLRKNWKAKNPQGVEVGERFVPFDRVGVYVPGGKAPLDAKTAKVKFETATFGLG